MIGLGSRRGWCSLQTVGVPHSAYCALDRFLTLKGKDREAALYMLDTMDGTVTKYITTGPVYPDPPGLYGHDDPGAWRGDWCFDTKGAD